MNASPQGGKELAPESSGRESSEPWRGVGPQLPEIERLVLTEADRALLTAKAGRGIARALMAQAIMAGFAIVVSWAVGGLYAGVSALVGAAAYFVPNALFAMRLLLGLFSSKQASALAFFWGEAIKLGGAVLVLGVAAYMAASWLVWPAVVFGLLCVLKGYVLLLMFRGLP